MSRRSLSVSLVALFALATSLPATEPAKTTANDAIDARLRAAATTAINQGAPLYNRGETSSCYYLYLGVLMTADSLLEHRPGLQKSLRAAMKKGRDARTFAAGAVALREGMDELLKALPKMMAAPAEKSLYERLGGGKAITAVVDDFVARAAKNPKVNFTRKGTDAEWEASKQNVAVLKKHLVQFVSTATGGPKTYEGRDMKSAHKGMKIADAEFDALAGDLKATLEKFKVPQKEIKELLTIVGTTRKDIVEKKDD